VDARFAMSAKAQSYRKRLTALNGHQHHRLLTMTGGHCKVLIVMGRRPNGRWLPWS
jgi:hypothetical protein